MQSNNRYRGIDTYALSCARYHARWLTEKHPCFTAADYEDIEQELILYFLLEAPKFDPEKSSWKLHISMIIKKRAIWLKIKAETQKRGGRVRPLSIHENIPAETELEQDVALVDATLSENGLWGDAYFAWSHLGLEIRTDIQKVIDGLPPRLQQLCEWLKESNPSEIARDTGIPRTTINSAIGTLRKRLRDAGLENYFHVAPSHPEKPAKPIDERAKKKETNDA